MHDEPVLVAVPTYDERENVEEIVARVRAAVPDVHVLVVDDASPDGTGEVADAIAARDDHVHVLHRAGKQGLGAAYVAAFGWARERGYGVVVEMDADGSHLPEQLPRLLAALADHDVVLGSRWVPGGSVVNWPLHRRLLSRGGSLYTRLALGIDVRDATGGYRAYSADALDRVLGTDVESQGYCFQIDMVRRALDAGLRVTEVPITFVERVRGESKMSRAIVVEAVRRVTLWGVERRRERWRRR
ncbi:polyprenol monophosphomannose synthase [Cellulosimicrobium marinum]|uniref:polyprenol monophosphomannose synthase n=1 Tax=Cellulosimicrobium marinum TaxID=1638992 RepID=UPI001E4B59F3|nr:polyprenol monophosphomannose synthase [Cellulosimicrobium marinum]MCB7137056.1 polyprenol monophosphomannose synthase [Cellulosimicrobium marinum]